MTKSTKDLVLMGAALVGAYAAWLQIKKEKQFSSEFSNWFSSGSFGTGSFDFYGQNDDFLARYMDESYVDTHMRAL